MKNSESDVKDAITRMQQEQRTAAQVWEKNHEKEKNPNASQEYGSRYITKYHDRFDYFA